MSSIRKRLLVAVGVIVAALALTMVSSCAAWIA